MTHTCTMPMTSEATTQCSRANVDAVDAMYYGEAVVYIQKTFLTLYTPCIHCIYIVYAVYTLYILCTSCMYC